MAYVPADAQYVAYLSYEQAFATTHNSSLFGSNLFFELPQANFKVYPLDIVYEVEVELPEPQYNGTVTVLQLNPLKENNLTQELQMINSGKVRAPFNYDGFSVYELLMKRFGDQVSTLGFLSIANQSLVLSNDKVSALRSVEAILDEFSGGTSLFDNITVRRAVYASGVTDQNYVGLFVGMFSTQLNDTQMAVKSVLGSEDSIVVSRALLFPTPDIALQRYGQAHEIYRDANSYRILDSWLVVTYNYPVSRIRAELTGI